MRLACLHVPHFPLAAWQRRDPELRGMSVAVTRGDGPRARVMACSPEATRQGVSVGLSATECRVTCHSLVIRPASRDAERAAEAALCDVAYSFSPRVENAGDGTVYLDIEGLKERSGSETDLARKLGARTTTIGLDATIGVAATKIAAHLIALSTTAPTVIPAGEEWHFLAPLPIQQLEPSPALQSTLARWGIHRIGDLAALPASTIGARLGPEGGMLARRARGEDESPLVPLPPVLLFEEAVELDYGVETLEPLLFLARGLLDRLTTRIALRGFVCGDLRIAMTLANRGRDERTVTISAPSNDVKVLLALLRLHLETYPPGAPVERIGLSALPERLRATQLDLFRPSGPAPERLATTLARLTTLCGADRLGTPIVADSHRSDAYGIAPFTSPDNEPSSPQPEKSMTQPPAGSLPTCLAVRAIRPPRSLEVFHDRGQLDFIRLAESEDTIACPYSCTGRVVTSAGPWRQQGEWWRKSGFSRDYYDVQLSDGGVYRLFFDRRQQNWFVDGVYD